MQGQVKSDDTRRTIIIDVSGVPARAGGAVTADDKLPLFMAPVVRYERPEFRPAGLFPEMAVVVSQHGGQGSWDRIPGKVISKGRVWVTVEEVGRTAPGQPRRWKFRLDDQTDGTKSNYKARFRTLAQQEHAATFRAALDFLHQQGLRIEGGGPWGGREIELARIVFPGRRGEQAEPVPFTVHHLDGTKTVTGGE